MVAPIWLPHYANMPVSDCIGIWPTLGMDIWHDWASRVLCALIFSGQNNSCDLFSPWLSIRFLILLPFCRKLYEIKLFPNLVSKILHYFFLIYLNMFKIMYFLSHDCIFFPDKVNLLNFYFLPWSSVVYTNFCS